MRERERERERGRKERDREEELILIFNALFNALEIKPGEIVLDL